MPFYPTYIEKFNNLKSSPRGFIVMGAACLIPAFTIAFIFFWYSLVLLQVPIVILLVLSSIVFYITFLLCVALCLFVMKLAEKVIGK